MNSELIKSHLRSIPDFPKPGILFRDITTVFKDKDCLKELADSLSSYYKDKGITKVLGIESRGFILGSIIASRIGAGFIPVRKPGKLPSEVIRQEYTKEYGADTVEIHKDALSPDDVVLIHDDLLATGGTMRAAYELCQKFNIRKIYINCIIELTDLKGRNLFPKEIDVYCPIIYEGE